MKSLIQESRAILLEAASIIGYHATETNLKQFKSAPAWFTTKQELGEAFESSHLFKAKISGKILSLKEAKQLSKKLDLDWQDVADELTSNPTKEETEKLIKPFLPYCDGFFHRDFDPRDDQRDIEVVLVFNASKNAKITQKLY